MKILHRSFALLASALLVVAATADAGARATLRPFTVSLEGHANPVFTGPCSIVNDEEGSRHATHMGAITWESHETVDLCSNPPGGVVHGTMVLTAANGDQIFGEYETIAMLDFST